MTDNSSIDVSVANIWRAYQDFRKGKKPSFQIRQFESNLLDNIQDLADDLQASRYQHGDYIHMIVNDTKRRDIAVASVRDRVVHRLLYNYMVPLFDPHFIYDVWSCRKGKGLHAALDRTAYIMQKYQDYWLWRADITKFFDAVNHQILRQCIARRLYDQRALSLVDTIIQSHGSGTGIPIGNLTSQLFANIYLHELDRVVMHDDRSLAYMRYGDDWICFTHSKPLAKSLRSNATQYLTDYLKLKVNTKLDTIQKATAPLLFLGNRFG